MDLAIKNIIYDLLQFRRSAAEFTGIFKTQKHNANLCPKLQHRLESAFDAFDKYRRITYEIQGPRDQGVDVLIRQIFHDQTYFICFQIKSEDDLRDKTWLKSIKAQWFDSEKTYHEMLDYYILLCCDASNSVTKGKIRLLESEFSSIPTVHIIEPEYVLSFLRLSNVQTDAIIKAKLGSDDIVFRNGLSIVNDLTPTEAAVLFYLIYQDVCEEKESTDQEAILDSEFIRYVYTNTPDFDRDWFFEDEIDIDEEFRREYDVRQLNACERLSFDLEELKNLTIHMYVSGGCRVNMCEVQSLAILMMDGKERYGYTGDDLLFYMMDLFGPYKGYVPQQCNAMFS